MDDTAIKGFCLLAFIIAIIYIAIETYRELPFLEATQTLIVGVGAICLSLYLKSRATDRAADIAQRKTNELIKKDKAKNKARKRRVVH